MKLVHVAVGVIIQDESVFLTRRHSDAHQGGKWEFPGGKVESEETVAQALARELKEEVDIDILACQPLMEINHDYGDKQVKLDIFIVDQFSGEPSSQEGNEQQWASISKLGAIEFPEANLAIVEKLTALYA
ncbi:8-oxo-dGTP diphosphatase MutT [Thalassotalea euphylliae]|uniref:8-oxo-dGTP diphosphatase n=1 Tax=Thalassotalea euphylliae TaxID=1655234 RepID=A0A3E0U7L9_9GAMM|nr:8-oxo-dGTP diphosphatase MutT [Thalassotalea euphylliae]REL31912.1 8-oxo-dGTP diphosphatase MutT [Thalassotalea euphylliae]